MHLLSSALKGSEAFIVAPASIEVLPPCVDLATSSSESCGQKSTPRRPKHPSVMNALGNSEHSDDSDSDPNKSIGDKKNDDDDVSFYADLREAKNEKFGAPIPDTYFAARAAIDSENEFLNAMKNARAEFAEAKEETGSIDGAVKQIMDGIRKEEALEAAWDAADGAGRNGDDDDDRGENDSDTCNAFQ